MKKFRIVSRWVKRRVKTRRARRTHSRASSVRNASGRRSYLTHKELARALITERVIHFNKHYNLPLGKIAIRNQVSRWGSCSKKGNLNFNYKLLFLTAELRDYVIVHEICHVKEFNHGSSFWNLVSEVVPDYHSLNKALRKINARVVVSMDSNLQTNLQSKITQEKL